MKQTNGKVVIDLNPTIIVCIWSLLGLATIGCGGSKFVVKSDPPQAEVFFFPGDGKEKKSIGKTPLEMPSEEFRTLIGSGVGEGEFVFLSLEQPGYLTEKFTIPLSTFGAMVTSLNVKMKQGDQAKQEMIAKEVIDGLFVAQKFALMQQFERAHIELDKILTTIPNFSRALSMRASIYFAQKNFPESLKWYEAALKADPQMDEAVKMVTRVRQVLSGERVPANTPGATGPSKPPGTP